MTDGAAFETAWRAGLEQAELRIPCCDNCGAWNWYPLPRCRVCRQHRFTWRAVEPRGVVYSWTRVHRAFGEVAARPTPYIVAIIELSEARGVRLACLEAEPGERPSIGEQVSLAVGEAASSRCWVYRRASDVAGDGGLTPDGSGANNPNSRSLKR